MLPLLVGSLLAANPFLKIVIARIKAKGGWQVVFERIARGDALAAIARDYECSRHTMYKLLHKRDQLWDLFVEARRESAMALAEEATEIADAVGTQRNADGSVIPVTRDDIALAKLRVEQRRWLAQAYDKETFGIQPVANQSPILSIGALHLRVLQAPPTPKSLPSGAERPVIDAEVIEEPSTNEVVEAGTGQQ